MNKKILLTVLVLAGVLLAASYVGMVSAGKGQEKQYFKIHLVGLPDDSTAEIRWTPDPETGPMKHGRDAEWGLLDVLEVTIGDNTMTEGISYSCIICADYNSVTFKGVQRIRETITFSDIDGEEGTLEILAIGFSYSLQSPPACLIDNSYFIIEKQLCLFLLLRMGE